MTPATNVVREDGTREGWLPIRPTDAVFIKAQEPPKEWIAQLRELSPKSDEHGWLYLHWEAGDPWIPGQRWLLYEMIHPKWVDEDVLEELRGPHPRSEGHMCSVNVPKQFQCLCRRKRESWRGGPCLLITLTQYELFHKTGYFARPFWVIQGSKGGHKRTFNEQESEMLRLAELPGDAPGVGDLPYAPFDQRVVKHIIRSNRLSQLGVTLSGFRRMMGSEHKAYREQVARNLRAEYVKWFSEQLEDVNELFISAARKGEMDGERRTEIDWEKVEDASTAHYIETGQMLHPSTVR